MTTATLRPRDSLSLPPVPPPAPDGHRWRDRFVAAAFVLALAFCLWGAIEKRDLDLTEFENRRTAEWPAAPASLAAFRAFPPAFEAAFADRFAPETTAKNRQAREGIAFGLCKQTPGRIKYRLHTPVTFWGVARVRRQKIQAFGF